MGESPDPSPIQAALSNLGGFSFWGQHLVTVRHRRSLSTGRHLDTRCTPNPQRPRMVIHRFTYPKDADGKRCAGHVREGWYLFGLIPLYVRQL
jgi:hypothetical protein